MNEWINEYNFPNIYPNPDPCSWSWIISSSSVWSDWSKLIEKLGFFTKNPRYPSGGPFHRQETQTQSITKPQLRKLTLRWKTLNKPQLNSLMQQTPWLCFPIYKTGIIKFALPTSKNSLSSFNIYWELTRGQALCQGLKLYHTAFKLCLQGAEVGDDPKRWRFQPTEGEIDIQKGISPAEFTWPINRITKFQTQVSSKYNATFP